LSRGEVRCHALQATKGYTPSYFSPIWLTGLFLSTPCFSQAQLNYVILKHVSSHYLAKILSPQHLAALAGIYGAERDGARNIAELLTHLALAATRSEQPIKRAEMSECRTPTLRFVRSRLAPGEVSKSIPSQTCFWTARFDHSKISSAR
jgi:hypothetical protein